MQFVQPLITALYFISGGVLLFLAYSILRDNLQNRLNRITSTMLFFAALGPVFIALGEIIPQNVSAEAPFEESIIYNLFYIWELFFPSLLLFSWVYPVDRLSRFRRSRLRFIIFLPHLFHILLVALFKNPETVLNILDIESGEGFISLIVEPLTYLLKWVVLGFTMILSYEGTIFSAINLIYVAAAVYFIVRGRSLLTNEQLKKNSTTLIIGVSVAVALYAIAYLFPVILGYEVSENLQTILTILVLLVGGGAIIFSIIRHKFLDVTVLVRQSLVYTITSAILVGLYILVVGQANKFLTSFFGENTTIVNIAFIVLALLLFQPINIQLDNIIKKFFMKSRADYRSIMEELSRRFISVLDPKKLREMIVKSLQTALMVEKVYFVLFDDKLNEYVLLPDPEHPRQKILNRSDLFLRGAGQTDKPTLIDELNMYRDDSELAEELDRRQTQLIIPLKDADHLLGFLALGPKMSGFRYNAEDITMLQVISNQLVTVLTNARLYQDSLEKQRLHEEITMARQIQLDLLPKSPPSFENHEIYASSIPSRMIGGDFYDFIPKSNGDFAMVIADASGKGMQAALIVAQIQAMLRSEVGNNNEIIKIIANVNRHVTVMTSSEKFATMFYGEYNPAKRTFRYANAGHNYPVLVRADGSHQFLTEGGLLIGAFTSAEYAEDTVQLAEGDLIFIYTDGLSEAMNEDGNEEYGEQRIIDFVKKHRTLSADDIAGGILKDVREFDPTDPPRDDTTIVILKIRENKIESS